VVVCIAIVVGFLVWKKKQDSTEVQYKRRSSFRGHRAEFAISNAAYEVPSVGDDPITYSPLSGSRDDGTIQFTSGRTPAEVA